MTEASGFGTADANVREGDGNERQTRQWLFLVENGCLPATESQELYELAWENEVRPVDERALKEGSYLDNRRKHVAGGGESSGRRFGYGK
jgi:hypothetical protein